MRDELLCGEGGVVDIKRERHEKRKGKKCVKGKKDLGREKVVWRKGW